MKSELKICSCCIIDSNMPELHLDENGICNYCKIYNNSLKTMIFSDSSIE